VYWNHFGLNAEPFSLTPDPAFLYMSEGHAEALAALKLGLLERRGLLAMIGEVGTGKTTLLYSLLAGLDAEVKTAYVSNTRLSFDGILRSALADFGLTPRGVERLDMLECLNDFLVECAEEDTTAALIIDEAQNLSPEAFEEIRLLSNFETYTTKLLQIVLVGQPELATKLNDRGLRQISERIAVRCFLNPLNEKQARSYVEHRLEAAGGPSNLFTARAIRKIVEHSRGIPRRINILCHNALLFAYGRDEKTITPTIVAEVIRDQEGAGLRRFDDTSKAQTADTTKRSLFGRRVPLVGWMGAGLAVGSLATWLVSTQPGLLPSTTGPAIVENAQAAATVESVAQPSQASAAQDGQDGQDGQDRQAREERAARIARRRAAQSEMLSEQVQARLEKALAELAAVRTTALEAAAVPPAAAVATAPSEAAAAEVAAPEKVASVPTKNIAMSSNHALIASVRTNAPAGTRTVRIARGSTLSEIMVGIYGDYTRELLKQVTAANPHIADPNSIQAGEIITLPDISMSDANDYGTKNDE